MPSEILEAEWLPTVEEFTKLKRFKDVRNACRHNQHAYHIMMSIKMHNSRMFKARIIGGC